MSASIVIALSALAQATGPDIEPVLARAGERVREYFQRAQSLIALETVQLLPIGPVFTSDAGGRPRRLVYELRLAWDPAAPGEAPEASVQRTLLTINGRTPRKNDQDGCYDPKPVSPEPLSMLLPERRREYIFTFNGSGRVDGRAAEMLDYKSAVRGQAEVKWRDDCASVSLPGWSRGRLWIDPATGDVLRLDEHLAGMFDVPASPTRARFDSSSMTIERADSSIRYKPVVFHEPDEVLMLPATIETLTVVRGSGVPTLRMTQKLTDYKRFLADSQLVTDPR